MQTIPANQIRNVLRHNLGFSPSKGNGTGHEAWVDCKGRTCHPVLRRKDIAIAIIYSLSLELESKGVIPRRDFVNLVKGR